MNTGWGKIIFTFFLLIVAWVAPAQTITDNTFTITVQKPITKEPLPDVIVKIIPLTNQHKKNKDFTSFTDNNGTVTYNFTEAIILQISHIGFTSITDTLLQPENKTYFLNSFSQEIGEVVVTGQYAPGSVQKSLYEIKVISQNELKARGANNLREALQTKLNIDLGQDAVFGSSIGINGISGEGIKIMVDGVPVVGRMDGKLDLSQINLNNIDHIEIVEGPLSVIYGTDAMGGVVNVITKTFQQEKINLNLKGYYESVGQYNVEINTGFAFKKSQIYLSGGRCFFNGFTTLDSIQRFKEWKPKEQYFADAKYILNGNKFRFSVTGSFFRELMLNRSEPTRALSYENGDTAWTYIGNDLHFLTYRPRAAASFMYRFKENSRLDMLLAYSGFFRFANKYYKNLVSGSEHLVANDNDHDTTIYHQITARATYSLPANFQFGTDINQEYTQQTNLEGKKKQSGDYAIFGSAKIKLIEGLDVQPAIRFSYNTRFRVPLIPSLNIRYNYKDKITVRVSYGRGYRAPSLKESFLAFFDINHSLKGNPQLKPEDGHCVNASLNITQPIKKEHSLNFTAAGFYNNIRNKIDWKMIPSIGPEPDTFQYFNIKKYITYGGSIGLGYNWKRLQANVSTQITRYELSATSDFTTVKMLSPDFSASTSYLIPKAEIGININYKYNGIKPLFSVNSSIQTGTRDAYHWIDISLSRNFWKNRIQVVIGGKNLAGVLNVSGKNISGVGHNFGGNSVNVGWGRTFFTSLVFHFSK